MMGMIKIHKIVNLSTIDNSNMREHSVSHLIYLAIFANQEIAKSQND
jgi:hypothetical protein